MASRTGSARVFFEVVGSFQAEKLLKDTQATSTVMQAIMLDAFGGVFESVQFAFEGIVICSKNKQIRFMSLKNK